jgi:polyhydroxyalkanoate synthesis regulator protein
VPFLRQLIRFYDDSIGRMVPGYLQFSLENLVKEQEKIRAQFATAFSNPAAAFEVYQDQARKNMQMFEQALSMWSPFTGSMTGKRGDAKPGADKGPAPDAKAGDSSEISELKTQLANMQQKIDKLTQDRD